jgi:hypothetical protein
MGKFLGEFKKRLDEILRFEYERTKNPNDKNMTLRENKKPLSLLHLDLSLDNFNVKSI